ncbi:uncharacterized protein PpBr36_11356 [Pyricularia pennisetigena]|uniref:uncharacterized protein n=1 Tax=Pyricularia pennisetigena TaxID=1578925 RepID=UPI001150DC44|nr:uncharacterized protein PpBr36_11356 [Pyricularia pennisetigena]TLS20372.1 hypothetical protein PpBr36_11356 [Pyricularia pennisetigena]
MRQHHVSQRKIIRKVIKAFGPNCAVLQKVAPDEKMEGISKKSPEKQEYNIHSHLVSEQSATLRTTVHGEFKEAKDGFVTWDDIDERTFLSFWDYVYTGDYDDPELVVGAEEDTDDSSIEHDGITDANGPNHHSAQASAAEEHGLELQPEEVAIAETEAPSASIWVHTPEKKAKRRRIPKREVLWNDFQKSWPIDMSIYVEYGTRSIGSRPTDHGELDCSGCSRLNDAVVVVSHAKVLRCGAVLDPLSLW